MVFDTFWSRALKQPDRIALIEDDGSTVSAGMLFGAANQLVHGLRARGLRPGGAIAAVLPNSRQAYELYLAVQQAGWYLVPINYHLVGSEIAYILRDCEAGALIFHERYAAACEAAIVEARLPPSRAFVVGARPGFPSFESLKAGQPTALPEDRTLGQ